MQRQMAELYLRQKRKGGIIDLEAEGVKLLVMTEDDSMESQFPCLPGSSLNSITSHSSQVIKDIFTSNHKKLMKF